MGSPLLQAYLDHLQRERRLSPNTVKAVARDLSALPADPTEIGFDQLREMLMRGHQQGLAPASLARQASSLRGFFGFLHQQGHMPSNPAERLTTPKKAQSLPKALKPEQVDTLLTAKPEWAGFAQQRTRMLITLLYSTGLRISEALSLQWSDCQQPELGGSWLSVGRQSIQVTGKGGKSRAIPLLQSVCNQLEQYRLARQVHLNRLKSPVESSWVFVGARGLPLSVRQAQLDMAKFAQLTGLDRHVHPHMLRHTFGSHLLQESQNLRAVQELLGHASIKSTQVYTALDFKHLSAVYDQAFPRAKSADSSGGSDTQA